MASQLRDPSILTLAEAAALLGVSYAEAKVMARAGDFPGVIEATRKSGSPRRWLVSLPRFNEAVHGTTKPPAPAKGRAEIHEVAG